MNRLISFFTKQWDINLFISQIKYALPLGFSGMIGQLAKEMDKILTLPRAAFAIGDLARVGALKQFLPEVCDLIRQEVVRVNRSLAEDEQLLGAQIRRFLLLHKELDADDQEITRTRKVRRGFVAQKYAALIDALYSDREHVQVEALVTYEDGRTGSIRADVRICDAETSVVGAGR